MTDDKREKYRAYSKANRDKINAQRRRHYHASNIEARLAKRREDYREHKEEIALTNRKRRYGITGAEFDALLQRQGGTCAVCHKSEWSKRGPMVDHDHETGRVRGIVCHFCNAAMGLIGDDPKIAQAIINYLHGGE